IVLVVADSQAAARDAAELVETGYATLPHVTTITEAVESGAPQLWPQAPGNIAIDWSMPTVGAGGGGRGEIFRTAAHVARVTAVNQRISVSPMETRGATATYDAKGDRYLLRSCSQGATSLREQLVAVLGVKREQLDVLSEDVGGAFGMKTSVYP